MAEPIFSEQQIRDKEVELFRARVIRSIPNREAALAALHAESQGKSAVSAPTTGTYQGGQPASEVGPPSQVQSGAMRPEARDENGFTFAEHKNWNAAVRDQRDDVQQELNDVRRALCEALEILDSNQSVLDLAKELGRRYQRDRVVFAPDKDKLDELAQDWLKVRRSIAARQLSDALVQTTLAVRLAEIMDSMVDALGGASRRYEVAFEGREHAWEQLEAILALFGETTENIDISAVASFVTEQLKKGPRYDARLNDDGWWFVWDRIGTRQVGDAYYYQSAAEKVAEQLNDEERRIAEGARRPLTRALNSKIVRAYTSQAHKPGVPSTLIRALLEEGVFVREDSAGEESHADNRG